jgi:RNA polymerase sigma factor (sigma-70 family)
MLPAIKSESYRKADQIDVIGDLPPPLPEMEQEKLILSSRESARRMTIRMLAHYRFRLDHQELQSLVDLSLCEAAKKFRPGLGATFVTFSFYYIKGNLLRIIDSAVRSSNVGVLTEDGNIPDDREPFFEENPGIALEKKESSACLREALGVLTTLQRRIIESIFFEDQSATTVARNMRLSRGHVSRLKSAALKTISMYLDVERLAGQRES